MQLFNHIYAERFPIKTFTAFNTHFSAQLACRAGLGLLNNHWSMQ